MATEQLECKCTTLTKCLLQPDVSFCIGEEKAYAAVPDRLRRGGKQGSLDRGAISCSAASKAAGYNCGSHKEFRMGRGEAVQGAFDRIAICKAGVVLMLSECGNYEQSNKSRIVLKDH